MPVTVAEILVFVPRIGLGLIITAATPRGGRLGGYDGRSGAQMQADIALEVNRKGEIRTGGKVNNSATGGRSGFDGSVDRGRIESIAIALRAEGSKLQIFFRLF